MSAGGEPLVAVEPSRWHLFLESFSKDWPRGAPGYYVVDTQLAWWRRQAEPCMRFYCPHGDIDEGLVAINEKPEPFNEVIILSIKDEPDVLENALVNTKLIDWTKAKMVPFAPVNIQKLLHRLTKRLPIVIHKEHPTFGFMKKKGSKLYDMDIPDDLYLGKLRQEHLTIVDENWPHRFPNSEKMFERLIHVGQGYGIFRKSDDRLLTWTLQNESGFMNHLCTVDESRRSGHAELITKYINNSIVQEGRDVIGYTVFENWPPLKLLLKLGQDVFGVFVWIELMPKEDTASKSKL